MNTVSGQEKTNGVCWVSFPVRVSAAAAFTRGKYFAAQTIAAQAAQAAFRGQAPHLRELAGTDLSKIRSGVLASAIQAGDAVIKQIVVDAATHIGIAVAGAVHLLAPDVVVLGGGLVDAMPELFVNAVRQAADEHVMPAYADTFQIVAAELGDNATVLGAAAWASAVIGSSG